MILKLPLTAGQFVVLVDSDGIQTLYTDSAGTSRSAHCAPAAFVAWAEAALAECRLLAPHHGRDQCPN